MLKAYERLIFWLYHHRPAARRAQAERQAAIERGEVPFRLFFYDWQGKPIGGIGESPPEKLEERLASIGATYISPHLALLDGLRIHQKMADFAASGWASKGSASKLD